MSYRRRPLMLLVHEGAVHLWWVRSSNPYYGGDTPLAVNSGYGFAWPAQMPMLMTTSTPFVWIARVPFWLPSVGFAAASLVIWRVERRRRLRQRHSLCMACGYDRLGLAVGNACPECGGVST
jgi:hypothetical protein